MHAATRKVSGSWSNSLVFTPDNASSDCSVLGHFLSDGGGQLKVVELHAPGFDGDCSTAKFFIARVSVSASGLRARNSTYRISDAKPAGEKVAPDCNQAPTQGISTTCAYSWSDTVALSPAP